MSGSAVRIVRDRVRAQVEAAQAQEAAVRQDDAEGVHQMRVALRRLRSTLVTFRPLMDREVSEPLREEIKWIAALLGGVRDTQVMQERFARYVASEPSGADTVAAGQLLHERLARDLESARTELAAAMASARYAELMRALDSLARPPWAPDAQRAGGGKLRKRIRHDLGRLRDAVRLVEDASSREERDERLHEVRKAAKRVRYAAETVEPRYGRDARPLAEAAEAIQELLGDQHDAVTALALLRETAGAAAAADSASTAFVLGRLHARTERESDDLIADFDRAWRQARRPTLRRWLR